MRSIVFAPVFLVILTLACCDGGIFTPDDDDSADAEQLPLLATGLCAPGRGQEMRRLTMDWEQQAEVLNTHCYEDEQCPEDWLCYTSDSTQSDPYMGNGHCAFNVCRPADADEDCGPGVLCYVRDFAVTAGRCAGGPH